MEEEQFQDALTGIRAGGCAQPYLSGFAAELTSRGYALLTTQEYARSAAHLGRWMDTRRIGFEPLTDATITAFAVHRCRCRELLITTAVAVTATSDG